MCGQPRRRRQDAKRAGITNTNAVESKVGRHFNFCTPDRSGFEFAQVAVTLALACHPTRKPSIWYWTT